MTNSADFLFLKSKLLPLPKICSNQFYKFFETKASKLSNRHCLLNLAQNTAEEVDSLRFHFGILEKGLHFKYLPNIFSGISVHARPHPGPLPQGEGERHHVAGQFPDPRFRHRSCVICRRRRTTQPLAWVKTR